MNWIGRWLCEACIYDTFSFNDFTHCILIPRALQFKSGRGMCNLHGER